MVIPRQIRAVLVRSAPHLYTWSRAGNARRERGRARIRAKIDQSMVKAIHKACTGYLGYPFENRELEGTASGLSMEDDRVFGGGEAARRTLALSGTHS